MRIARILEIEKEMNEKAAKGECKRKQVGCALSFDGIATVFGTNGPSAGSLGCSNEVGNCGCSHAEPRVIMAALKAGYSRLHRKGILVCTYSPCTNCANIILDSGLVYAVLYRIATEHDLRGLQMLETRCMTGSLKEIEESGYADIETWIQSRTDSK